MVHSQNGLLRSNKSEQITTTCNRIDALYEYTDERKKPTWESIPYDSIYVKFKINSALFLDLGAGDRSMYALKIY